MPRAGRMHLMKRFASDTPTSVLAHWMASVDYLGYQAEQFDKNM
jgi:hypothetical protein